MLRNNQATLNITITARMTTTTTTPTGRKTTTRTIDLKNNRNYNLLGFCGGGSATPPPTLFLTVCFSFLIWFLSLFAMLLTLMLSMLLSVILALQSNRNIHKNKKSQAKPKQQQQPPKKPKTAITTNNNGNSQNNKLSKQKQQQEKRAKLRINVGNPKKRSNVSVNHSFTVFHSVKWAIFQSAPQGTLVTTIIPYFVFFFIFSSSCSEFEAKTRWSSERHRFTVFWAHNSQ